MTDWKLVWLNSDELCWWLVSCKGSGFVVLSDTVATQFALSNSDCMPAVSWGPVTGRAASLGSDWCLALIRLAYRIGAADWHAALPDTCSLQCAGWGRLRSTVR